MRKLYILLIMALVPSVVFGQQQLAQWGECPNKEGIQQFLNKYIIGNSAGACNNAGIISYVDNEEALDDLKNMSEKEAWNEVAAYDCSVSQVESNLINYRANIEDNNREYNDIVKKVTDQFKDAAKNNKEANTSFKQGYSITTQKKAGLDKYETVIYEYFCHVDGDYDDETGNSKCVLKKKQKTPRKYIIPQSGNIPSDAQELFASTPNGQIDITLLEAQRLAELQNLNKLENEKIKVIKYVRDIIYHRADIYASECLKAMEDDPKMIYNACTDLLMERSSDQEDLEEIIKDVQKEVRDLSRDFNEDEGESGSVLQEWKTKAENDFNTDKGYTEDDTPGEMLTKTENGHSARVGSRYEIITSPTGNTDGSISMRIKEFFITVRTVNHGTFTYTFNSDGEMIKATSTTKWEAIDGFQVDYFMGAVSPIVNTDGSTTLSASDMAGFKDKYSITSNSIIAWIQKEQELENINREWSKIMNIRKSIAGMCPFDSTPPWVSNGDILPGPDRANQYKGVWYVINRLVPGVTNIILVFAVSGIVLVIILAGFMMYISGMSGMDEFFNTGQRAIVGALVGVLLATIAYAFVKMIIGLNFTP